MCCNRRGVWIAAHLTRHIFSLTHIQWHAHAWLKLKFGVHSAHFNEDFRTLAEYDPLTGYEPNDYHILETFEPYIQESSCENGSLNSHDLEYDDCTIGMAPSSPLFTQEREGPACRRQA